jgi:hypothetical protein
MKTTPVPIGILVCTALFAVAGCKAKTVSHSTLTASSGGRDVHVSADGPAWVQAQEDHITVKLTGHEMVIEKERLLLDKQERAKLPPGVKKFEVTAQAGALNVTADGAEVLKVPK